MGNASIESQDANESPEGWEVGDNASARLDRRLVYRVCRLSCKALTPWELALLCDADCAMQAVSKSSFIMN